MFLSDHPMAKIQSRLTLDDLMSAGIQVRLAPDGRLVMTPEDRLVDWIPAFYAWRNELTAEALLRWPRPIPWRPGVARALVRVVRHQVEAETAGLGSGWWCMTWAELFRPDLAAEARAAERRVNAAWRRRDLLAVRGACLAWRRAMRRIIAAERGEAIPPSRAWRGNRRGRANS